MPVTEIKELNSDSPVPPVFKAIEALANCDAFLVLAIDGKTSLVTLLSNLQPEDRANVLRGALSVIAGLDSVPEGGTH